MLTDSRAQKHTLLLVAAVFCLGVAIWLAYGGAVNSPFIFDDRPSIEDNASIVRLWPLVGDATARGPLNPPKDMPTSGRPLVNLTFALNYHFGKLNPFGYHLFNMVGHFLTAILVGLIVQRLLRLEFFAERFAIASEMLAFLCALLWAVHPLNSETVVYMTQRTELMVAFFYLATIYAALRYWKANTSRQRSACLIAAMLACLAGMASKEMMVTAPVIVLLLERMFITGSFRQALRQSWPLYLGLSLGWLLLLALNYDRPRRFGRVRSNCLPPHLLVHAGKDPLDIFEIGGVALAIADSLPVAIFRNAGPSVAMAACNGSAGNWLRLALLATL